MSKTFGILQSATAALALAPMMWLLGRTLRIPTRLLIGLGNVLLAGRGLERGPFVTPEEIRAMADLGRKEERLASRSAASSNRCSTSATPWSGR
jgi:hypothetical protein